MEKLNFAVGWSEEVPEALYGEILLLPGVYMQVSQASPKRWTLCSGKKEAKSCWNAHHGLISIRNEIVHVVFFF